MGRTSTDVKRRYNEKTYKRWSCDFRNEYYEQIEAMRGDRSRAQFLKDLVEFYCKANHLPVPSGGSKPSPADPS